MQDPGETAVFARPRDNQFSLLRLNFLPPGKGRPGKLFKIGAFKIVLPLRNPNLNHDFNFQTAGGKVKVVADALQVCD